MKIWLALAIFAALLIALAAYTAGDCGTSIKIGGTLMQGCK